MAFTSILVIMLIFSTISAAKFTPRQAISGSLNFLVLGDWGGLPVFPYRTPVEDAVAIRLGDIANATQSKFVLALGDNFYFDGVQSIEDPRFQETYNKVFTQTETDIDWYLIAGNHDHNGNISAQVDFTGLMRRWNFPSLYYKLAFGNNTSGQHVEVVMLDTIVLCGNSDSDILGLQPPGPLDQSAAEKQWIWLETQLKTSSAPYLIVAGHYPVFSIAEHGPTQCLTDRLLPLLYKYRVTAYISGHDHNLQHLSYTKYNHTVNYFVSGAANFIDLSRKHESSVPPGSLKYHWADIFSLGALATVQITPNNLTWTFVEANGKQLYTHVITPRS